MTEEIPTVKGAHVTTLHKGTHLSAFWYKGAHLTTHISVYLPTYLSSFSLEYITITMFMEDSKRLHTKRCYTSGNKKHTKKAHKHAQKAFTGPPSKDSYSYWSCSNGDLNPPFRPPSAQSNSGWLMFCNKQKALCVLVVAYLALFALLNFHLREMVQRQVLRVPASPRP